MPFVCVSIGERIEKRISDGGRIESPFEQVTSPDGDRVTKA